MVKRRTGQGQDKDANISSPVQPSNDLDSKVEIALKALESIAKDDLAPAAARASAARTILEYSGALGKHQKPPTSDDTRSLSEMSREDLMAEFAAMRRDMQGK